MRTILRTIRAGSTRRIGATPVVSPAQLFLVVWVRKLPNSGVTLVPLQLGHLIAAFSLSEMVMRRSNGFSHFSHMNSYVGMMILRRSALQATILFARGPSDRIV